MGHLGLTLQQELQWRLSPTCTEPSWRRLVMGPKLLPGRYRAFACLYNDAPGIFQVHLFAPTAVTERQLRAAAMACPVPADAAECYQRVQWRYPRRSAHDLYLDALEESHKSGLPYGFYALGHLNGQSSGMLWMNPLAPPEKVVENLRECARRF